MQQLGLQAEYQTADSDIRLFVRKALALAFLPQNEVIEGFEELFEACPVELQEFFTYVEDTHIGRYIL